MDFVFSTGKTKTSSWVIRLSIVLAVLMTVLIVWQGTAAPKTSLRRDELQIQKDNVQISQTEGAILSVLDGEVTVYIPCCILGGKGEVSVTEMDATTSLIKAGMNNWARPNIINVEYTSVEGKRVENAFTSTPLEICFQLSSAEWAAYTQAPLDYQIQYYDAGTWRSLNMIPRKGSRSLCGSFNSLSLISLAVKGKSIPITGENGLYQP